MWKTALPGLALVAGLTACEEKSSKITLGDKGAAACDVTLDSLADTEWLFLKANPDKSEVPDLKTRLKFVNEDGGLRAKYNVGSVADMYTYDCTRKDSEVICKEKPKVKDWCQALIAGGAECTAETLRKIEPSLTDDEVKAGMAAADEVVKKFKDTPQWDQFVLNNNNLGNKLRGLLYVKVDERKCRLVVQDNYMTLYNGKEREDSNPAGINPFVKNDEGELLWEHCTNRDDLVALSSAEMPADPQQATTVTQHGAGTPVHYWYLAGDTIQPVEGCEFSYDVWQDARPVKKGVKPELDESGKEPRLKWHYAHTFAAPSASGEGNVTTFVVNAKCDDPKKLGDGWKNGKRVACNAVLVQ